MMSQEDQASLGSVAKKAFEALRETEEGRKLSVELRDYLKNMNKRFEDVSTDERQQLMDEFKSKFGLYVEKMKNIQSEEGGSKTPASDLIQSSPNYQLFFIAILIILLLFGFFGYKLYLSIMEKQQKKEKKSRKQLKEERKNASSPPASPSSKKQS